MSVVLAEPAEPGPAGLEEWAQSFLTLAQVSGAMARTAFVPNSLRVFRNDGRDYDQEATAAQVTAAILAGRELGLEPMAALRSINVINSTPALSALALRAIVLSAGHRIWVEEATNTRAAVAGVRAGDTHEQRVTWTIDDAKARGLAGRPNWRSQPRNMLIARATAEVARLIAADAILGVPYVIEELEDEDVDRWGDKESGTAETKPLRRRRKPATPAPLSRSEPRAEPAAPEDEPPLDDEPDLPAPKASEPQLKKMFALFNERGLTDRDERLDWTNRHLDRTVISSTELTDVEASRLIETLVGEQAADAPPAAAATEPSAPDAGEQQTFDEPQISRDRAEILMHMSREAGVTDPWTRLTLTELGAQVGEDERITSSVIRRLTKLQASRLQAALNDVLDAGLQDE